MLATAPTGADVDLIAYDALRDRLNAPGAFSCTTDQGLRSSESPMIEALLRAATFASLVAILAFAEWRRPRNPTAPDRRHRWPVNFTLGVINVVAVRVLMPWVAVDAAHWSELHRTGLLRLTGASPMLGALLGFMLLDLAVYAQHLVSHRLPLLWRLHRLHHTDLVLDVSSAVRFHPLEILLSMAFKTGVVLLLGVSAETVIAFEIALSAFALFTHANLAFPIPVDQALRSLFVTPDMHKIHHSVERAEHDRNFGFQFSVWDRLFGTYLARGANPPARIRLGLREFRSPAEQRLPALLLQPLR